MTGFLERQGLKVSEIHKRHLQLYHAKKKPYVNVIQERRRLLWAKAHFKWKTVLWLVESNPDIWIFGNHVCHVLWTPEQADHQAHHSKACLSDGMGSLHMWKGTTNAEHMLQTACLSGKAFYYHSKTMVNHIQHGFSEEESGGCRQARLSPKENIWCIVKGKNPDQKSQDC